MEITLVIGGARSGKSSFALNEASKIKGQKAYIATAEALDDEMKERILKHKKDRGEGWDSYEEPIKVSNLLLDIKDKYSIIVIDCLTLWLSNLLLRTQIKEQGAQTVEESINEFIDDLQKLKNGTRNPEPETRFFIVSNEVGMGIVPDNEVARRFRDLAGYLNQKIAEIADEVYLLTAGIPLKIKHKK